MTHLPVFDKYFNEEDAEYYYQLFTWQGLSPVVEPPKANHDAIFGDVRNNPHYILRLPAHEFAAANDILDKEIHAAGLPQDY